MTNAEPSHAMSPTEAYIEVTRVFDAPRRLVFEAWTKAELFKRWFGPRDMGLPYCEIDPRPGGVIHFCHEFPDGARLWVKGAYREVVAPDRLVFSLAFVDTDGRPCAHPMFPDWPLDAVFTTTVTFEERAGRTTLTARQTLTPPEAAASEPAAHMRPLAREGWEDTLDRLAELVGAGSR